MAGQGGPGGPQLHCWGSRHGGCTSGQEKRLKDSAWTTQEKRGTVVDLGSWGLVGWVGQPVLPLLAEQTGAGDLTSL